MPNPVNVVARAFARRKIRSKSHLRWWLIWGPPRSGTTLMQRLVAAHARLEVSDWGLRHLMNLPPEYEYIRFDRARYRRDLRNNILDNARFGGGTALDLVFKQAGLWPDERRGLEWLFGPPERVIFCLRGPAGFMASAQKKFKPNEAVNMQTFYLRTLGFYEENGGDVFDYRPGLSMEDYDRFLQPLGLPPGEHEEFEYRGTDDSESCTPRMWEEYEKLAKLQAPPA